MILLFVLGFIIGGFSGVLCMAFIFGAAKLEEREEQRHFCKDCRNSFPSEYDSSCYWCDELDCDVYGHTEACDKFSPVKVDS